MLNNNREPFELLEHLGTGAFAQTWRARVIDPKLIDEWGREEVAIKIPLDKDKERILKKELLITGSLHLQLTEIESVNIVKYLGFEIFNRTFVIVMEYVSGGNLRNLISQSSGKKLKIEKAIAIAEGILKGLCVIHKRNIVHRDIKPENILMDGNTPKIADLGLGRLMPTNKLASSTVGTLYYTSPELLYENAGASFNTDIWSLGVTLYEMICGQFPFGIHLYMPVGKVVSLIKDDNIPLEFPNEIKIPIEIKNIISKALTRNPKNRYQTAEEMLNDIKFLKGEAEVIEKELGLIRDLLQSPTQTKLAESRLKELLKKFPNCSSIYIQLGELYNRCENYTKAIEIFRKGIEIDSENALLYWGITISYVKQKRVKEAINALKKALELGLEKSLERYAKILLKQLQENL
jgi:serine/threonine-protein kinase